MFRSYAQNGEDVVLWRVLGHVENGRWIDVGANDPDTDSVTRVFSDAGWTGINIEPMEPVFSNLVDRRPNDINLRIAIEDSEGQREYFAVGSGRSLSTSDPLAAEKYRNSGLSVDSVLVPTRTLASVWDEFIDGEVQFLKVDVEGAESRVLAGADFTRHRPWVVVVESVESVDLEHQDPASLGTRPIPASRHEEWERHLTENGYRFVMFDGLNRFYVAREHELDLAPRLEAPVNILDQSLSAASLRIIAELEGQLECRIAELADRLESMTRQRDAEHAEAEALRNTLSWRVTAPLRMLRRNPKE